MLVLRPSPVLAEREPEVFGSEVARLQNEAARVTIVRDDWGIAHVHGATDADAVFGAIYAQAEDDFNRVESNYIDALGYRAMVDGPEAIPRDLREQLFVDPAALRAEYAASPPKLRALMDAWADGLNFFLLTHPAVHPRLISHFLPWMTLSFTEGSIGGDVERISLDGLREFYEHANASALRGARTTALDAERDAPLGDPSGSNGIAIAPSLTTAGHALLLINPHTSLFFRSELQMTSDAGLDAYGAATWGQFFIYQGFNEHVGWMHTSSGVDTVDFFAETIVRHGKRLFYRYGKTELPLVATHILVSYRTPNDLAGVRAFTVYRTRHGPIVRAEGGHWISVSLMQKPIEALEQSFYRTKATDFASFRSIADAHRANSSNNTIFADDKGEIAFLTPQFIPRRDDRFDYTQPVDGADPATAWKGLHAFDETPHAVDPPNGWVFNTNDWPYSAAGASSPKRAAFPRYMDTFGENARGVHATRLLSGREDFTLESLLAAAFDPAMPAFDELIPQLLAAYDTLPPAIYRTRGKLVAPIATLRAWDRRWSAESVPTSLAVYYGEALSESLRREPGPRRSIYERLRETTAAEKIAALAVAIDRLTTDFGTWQTPWGDINRFQRRNDDIAQRFDDGAPSIPVPFTPGVWGSLAALDTDSSHTKRRYGVGGNSFVAVVEFGPRVRAKAVTAGGESGDPASLHFFDQAARYSAGDLRDVYFYPDQLPGHTERRYHPGT